MDLFAFTQEKREPRRERVIVHVDIDCFYASCERLREPELEDEPVVVGRLVVASRRHISTK